MDSSNCSLPAHDIQARRRNTCRDLAQSFVEGNVVLSVHVLRYSYTSVVRVVAILKAISCKV